MRDARLARGWTVRDLARESGAAHENTISAWEAGSSSPKVDQLSPVLAALGLRLSAEEGVVPLPEGRAHARVEPLVRFGVPHIRGVSCEAIAGMVVADGVEAAMGDYTLRREDVLTACWYMGRYGGRRWRFWRKWALDMVAEMWASRPVDYSKIPDPPDRPDSPVTNP
jgi:transcriptional regulator with XRE-family HTH domain